MSVAVMCIEVHVELVSQAAQRFRAAQSMMPESLQHPQQLQMGRDG